MKLLGICVVCLVAVSASSCALIVSGYDDTVTVTSDPSGADVYLDGGRIGRTPMEAEIRRGREHEMKFDLDGYEPVTIHVGKNFNYWILGNLTGFFWILGGIVDLATWDPMWCTDSDFYHASLREERLPRDAPTHNRRDDDRRDRR